MAAFTWVGPAVAPTILNIGPLAVLAPLLDRLDVIPSSIVICLPTPNSNFRTAIFSAC